MKEWWRSIGLRIKIIQTEKNIEKLKTEGKIMDSQIRLLRAQKVVEVCEYQWSYFENKWWRMREIEDRITRNDAGKVVLENAKIACYRTELDRLWK